LIEQGFDSVARSALQGFTFADLRGLEHGDAVELLGERAGEALFLRLRKINVPVPPTTSARGEAPRGVARPVPVQPEPVLIAADEDIVDEDAEEQGQGQQDHDEAPQEQEHNVSNWLEAAAKGVALAAAKDAEERSKLMEEHSASSGVSSSQPSRRGSEILPAHPHGDAHAHGHAHVQPRHHPHHDGAFSDEDSYVEDTDEEFSEHEAPMQASPPLRRQQPHGQQAQQPKPAQHAPVGPARPQPLQQQSRDESPVSSPPRAQASRSARLGSSAFSGLSLGLDGLSETLRSSFIFQGADAIHRSPQPPAPAASAPPTASASASPAASTSQAPLPLARTLKPNAQMISAVQGAMKGGASSGGHASHNGHAPTMKAAIPVASPSLPPASASAPPALAPGSNGSGGSTWLPSLASVSSTLEQSLSSVAAGLTRSLGGTAGRSAEARRGQPHRARRSAAKEQDERVALVASGGGVAGPKGAQPGRSGYVRTWDQPEDDEEGEREAVLPHPDYLHSF